MAVSSSQRVNVQDDKDYRTHLQTCESVTELGAQTVRTEHRPTMDVPPTPQKLSQEDGPTLWDTVPQIKEWALYS